MIILSADSMYEIVYARDETGDFGDGVCQRSVPPPGVGWTIIDTISSDKIAGWIRYRALSEIERRNPNASTGCRGLP
jgi:hypothetical protein